MDFVSRQIDFNQSNDCTIIGEIGVNHNNDSDILFKLIDAGINAGVDIIKLQRFSADAEISTFAPKANYQTLSGVANESQLEMARSLQLSDDLITKAYRYCQERNVGFLCAAFDHESVDFIAETLQCKTIKVPSPEITNIPLLQHMSAKFDSMIVSTGASYLSECLQVVDLLKASKVTEISLMHCVSEYPAPLSEANLSVMKTMKEASMLPIGYSDHTQGIIAPIVAASLGAVMIEKHFTLDKNMPGPDHKASADIDELTSMVKAVREAKSCIGDGVKRPVCAEQSNRPIIRKSIVCIKDNMPEGTVLDLSMLGIKRPETPGAVMPLDLDKIIGMKINTSKEFDEPIFWDDFR